MSPVTTLREELEALKKRDELQTKLQEAIRNYAPQSELREIERQLKEQSERLDVIMEKSRRPVSSVEEE